MMDQLLLRKRDLLVLLIVVFSIYFTFDTPKYQFSFSPAWYFSDNSKTTNRFYVKPLITDIDGDGSNEIIIISNDLYIRVLSTNFNKKSKSDIYTPKVIASTKLNKVNISKGKKPIAINSGYIIPYLVNSVRKQVIVVVTEDFSVTCFNHNLKMMWEKSLAHNYLGIDNFIDQYEFNEVSVFISPFKIRNISSNGTIYVGLSFKPKNINSSIEIGIAESEDVNDRHGDLNFRSKFDHFNLFALNSDDGSVIWRHLGQDVKSENYIKSLPQHAYTLDIQKLMSKTSQSNHNSVSDWTSYKKSLLSELPHQWRSNDDTLLRISRFTRQVTNSRNSITNDKPVKPFFPFTAALPKSAKYSHDVSEHIENPNVIVAHTSKGIEVISLLTGKPITSLALLPERLYDDFDGDNVVDTLVVIENSKDVSSKVKPFEFPGKNMRHCSIMAISGLPPTYQLFNGSICQHHVSINDPMSHRYPNSYYRDSLPNVIEATAPIIVPSQKKRTFHESFQKDIIVAINSGVITCFSGKGDFKWQIKDGPIWNLGFQYRSTLSYDSNANRVKEKGSHSSVGSNVLVLGEVAFHLISTDGEVLTVSDIPDSRIIASPIIGDFDSDGITDVIIATEDCFYGFKHEISESSKGLLLSFIILSIVALIVYVINIRSTYIDVLGRTNSVISKKKILTLFRSTDSIHND